jgi:SNF2 family DNA or RNA helicase
VPAAAAGRGPKRLLRPFILRRTKSQVLDDLPPVTTIQHDVVMSPGEAALYNRVREEALAKLANVNSQGKNRIQIFAELMRLRRLCCHPGLVAPEANLASSKLESFLELAEELVSAGHKILVFSQFTDVLALVKPLLKEKGITYQYLDGSTPAAQRTQAVDAFQAGEGDVFLISLRAGGFGLNLTAADYVIHLDPWWNPAVESQASDRAHRIGQVRPVTIYRLVTADTIESRIVQLHAEKRELADALLSETDRTAKLTAAELRGLLEQG